MSTQDQPSVAVIAIGRNEGPRLVECLASLQAQALRVIYVDSGSVDQSVIHARNAGAEVVELMADEPFTAARGRAAGFAQLKTGELTDYVQFLDGDCSLEPEWLPQGIAALEDNMELGLVTGWRREMHPEASIYNDLCEHEWNRPAGEITTCGGEMLLRAVAYEEAGGFDPNVIAAEDDEFCQRLQAAGWGLMRLPVVMTRHDAAIRRFGQWWQRAVRSGHGFAQVGHMHPPYFRTEQLRGLVYGGLIPLIALLCLWLWAWGLLAVGLIYALSYVRSYQGLRAQDMAPRRAAHHSVFLTLSKFPNILGMGIYHWRRLKRRRMQIIEYK